MRLWVGLMAICMVTSERVVNGVPVSEVRYYIGSADRTAEEYMKWVRGHWGIENSLHWVLDVCFREDEQRHWAGNSAENLSWLRKLALCLLKAAKNSKGKSIRRRRLRAGWKNEYLLSVLAQIIEIPGKNGAYTLPLLASPLLHGRGSRAVRSTRLAEIAYATPIRTGSLFLGKGLAMLTVALVIVLAAALAAVIVLLIQQKVGLELRPFLLVWGLLLTRRSWSGLGSWWALHAIAQNQYTTYALCLAVLCFHGLSLAHQSDQLGWQLAAFEAQDAAWSDISILGFDRTALVFRRRWPLEYGGLHGGTDPGAVLPPRMGPDPRRPAD